MSQEVLGLGSAGAGVRVGEVVGTADQASTGSTIIVTGEGGIDVGGTFSRLIQFLLAKTSRQSQVYAEAHLDHDESSTGSVSPSKVNSALVA